MRIGGVSYFLRGLLFVYRSEEGDHEVHGATADDERGESHDESGVIGVTNWHRYFDGIDVLEYRRYWLVKRKLELAIFSSFSPLAKPLPPGNNFCPKDLVQEIRFKQATFQNIANDVSCIKRTCKLHFGGNVTKTNWSSMIGQTDRPKWLQAEIWMNGL